MRRLACIKKLFLFRLAKLGVSVDNYLKPDSTWKRYPELGRMALSPLAVQWQFIALMRIVVLE